MRNGFSRDPREVEQGALDGRRPLLFGRVTRGGERRAAGVIDQNINLPEMFDGCCNQCADSVVLFQISGKSKNVRAGRASNLVRRPLKIGLRPAAYDELLAFLRER